MHYKISDGADSPYAAAMLGSLKHWLNETVEFDRTKIVLSDPFKKELLVNLKNVHIELDTSDIQKVLSMALDDDRDQALIFKPDW